MIEIKSDTMAAGKRYGFLPIAIKASISNALGAGGYAKEREANLFGQLRAPVAPWYYG
jgi:hypothetical protein